MQERRQEPATAVEGGVHALSPASKACPPAPLNYFDAASIRFQICPPPTHPPRSWFLRRHGDEMERLPGGYYRAHGRVDDTSERSSASHCHSAPALPLPSCRCWNVPKAFQILTLK